jgi:hypothetical protein
MAYGIDDVVQKKVDAYRGNPAALQQRYAQNQELVDLLALQKMKSEKESAAREVSMQMQNNPNTIAKQREQEVLGLTKNEMVKQTGDILKQRQAKQQSNMARMAQSGIKGQAQTPRMMAGGGIVALAPGGPIEAQEKFDEITAIRKQIADGTISKAEGYKKIEALSPGLSSAYRTKPLESGPAKFVQSPLNRQGLDATGLQAAITERNENQQSMDSTLAGMQGNALGTGALQGRGQGTAKAPPQKVFGMDDEYDGKPPVQPPAEPPKPYTAPQLDKGLGAVSAPTKRTQYLDGDYSVAMSDASSTADAQAGIKSLMDQKPKDVREEAMTYGLEQLGMSDDRVAAEQARQKALADFDAKQSKSNKSEELSAFLRGIGQSGRISGGSAAAANVRAQQQSGERARLLGRQQGERDFEGLEQEIKVKAYDSATKAFEIANQNVRQGVSSMTQFNATEVGLLSDNAKRLLDTDVANMEAEDRDAKRILDAQIANASNETKVAVANLEASISDRRTTLQNQMEKAKLGQLDRKDTNTLLNQVEKYQADVRAKYQKVYQDAIAALPFGDDNKAAEDALKVEMNAAITIALQGLAQRTKELETYLASLPTADGFGDLQ